MSLETPRSVGREITDKRVTLAAKREGCREEILAAARHLHSLGQEDFTPDEILRYLHDQGTRYAESTIRTHIISSMCRNAPDNHITTYDDLERVGYGRYRLI